MYKNELSYLVRSLFSFVCDRGRKYGACLHSPPFPFLSLFFFLPQFFYLFFFSLVFMCNKVLEFFKIYRRIVSYSKVMLCSDLTTPRFINGNGPYNANQSKLNCSSHYDFQLIKQLNLTSLSPSLKANLRSNHYKKFDHQRPAHSGR